MEASNPEESIDLEALEREDSMDDRSTDIGSLQDLELEVEAPDESWLARWRDFILNTDGFKWLITRLRRECKLVTTAPDAIRTIANEIMSLLPSPRYITKKMPSPSHSVIFELDWDIIHFFETQQYTDSPEKVIEGIITLTGSCLDAQAVTCAEYLHQTWPLTGGTILQLVKQFLIDEKEHSCKWLLFIVPEYDANILNILIGELPDGTILRATMEDFKFIVKAEGVAVTISEIAEQFGWLGAALRSSPLDSGLVFYTPFIKDIRTPPFSRPELSGSYPSMICTIGFELEVVPGPYPKANGQCWHGIFNNPVVVKGYPIPRRSRWDSGLEIPLKIMARLARSQRIDRFGDMSSLKASPRWQYQ